MSTDHARAFLPRIALCIGLSLVAAMVGAVGASAEEPTVKIDNFTFSPPIMTVKVGTTVTFENDDDIPHLVVANDGSFRSTALDTNDKYAFTFAKAGDFSYYCGLHPHMQGTIKVTQ